MAGCGYYHHHATKESYAQPSPPRGDTTESSPDHRAEVRELRQSLAFSADQGGWQLSRKEHRVTATTYDIAYAVGDSGALKVQCSGAGTQEQALDIYLHHPVLCGDRNVQAWFTDLNEGKWSGQLSNRADDSGDGCQTFRIQTDGNENSNTGEWLKALLKADGAAHFQTSAKTALLSMERDRDIIIDLNNGKSNLASVLQACGY